MKHIIIIAVSIIGLVLFATNSHALVGTQEISFMSDTSKRVITAEVFYPTPIKAASKLVEHGIWMRENYDKGAISIDTTKQYPLIVFSHGFKGDRFCNSWFAEKMAKQGYIVVTIDHTLNTNYNHSDLFVYTSMWQRPIDISELLTHLLQHPVWSKVIDKEKIYAAGFSLGGFTSLWLGGIQADKASFKKSLDYSYSAWNDWPQHDAVKAKSVDWGKAEQSYLDKRIKAVIAIAPDLGKVFTKSGLEKMNIPALIIVGDKDGITPKAANAEFYAKHIVNAELLTLKGAEHFTFMNKCSATGLKFTPHLCADDPNRDAVHEQAIQKATEFLANLPR